MFRTKISIKKRKTQKRKKRKGYSPTSPASPSILGELSHYPASYSCYSLPHAPSTPPPVACHGRGLYAAAGHSPRHGRRHSSSSLPFFPVACDGGLCSGRAFQAVAVTAFPSPGTAVFCSLAGGAHALGVGVRRGRHLYLAGTPYRLGDT